MTEPLPSIEKLEEKINSLREAKARENAPDPGPDTDGGMAMRIGAELVSGVGVGSFIGYQLDKWLGTLPWLFILCFFLGTAAGFLTMYRTATRADRASETKEREPS